MDLLDDHRQHIEKNIFFHMADLFNQKVDLADLFNQKVDLIFYDTTTASFSIPFPFQVN